MQCALTLLCDGLTDSILIPTQFEISGGELNLDHTVLIELRNKIKGKSRTAAPVVGSVKRMSVVW
jgi:hypothetical protein